MANFQVRYGCTLVETDVPSDITYDEGTSLTINSSTGKWILTTTATAKYRLVYTGYPSTRPDVLTVGKLKAVCGPGIVETDIISGAVSSYSYGDEVSAKSAMITALDTTAVGFVVGKSATTLTIQLY